NYWDTIRSEAEKRQLDPYLVASIIRQETGFEPATVSNAGAVGLMQIMPAEGESIATQAGLPVPTREQLFDPAINVAVGAAELAHSLHSPYRVSVDLGDTPVEHKIVVSAFSPDKAKRVQWSTTINRGLLPLTVTVKPFDLANRVFEAEVTAPKDDPIASVDLW